MSKEVASTLKLVIIGGKANPAPPVGPALGQRGVNIMQFCKDFNEKTKDKMGVPCPIFLTVYKDKSFDFVVKNPPYSYYIKKAAGLESASKEPGRVIAGTVTRSALAEIAKEKSTDMNCFGDINAAVKILEGSARSMGIKVVD
jgi:large subunit ribosomal protein L11